MRESRKRRGPLSDTSCSNLRSRTTNQSTMNSVIRQSRTIALLIIMAAIAGFLLAPAVLEQLPENWRSAAAEIQEALKDRLSALMERHSGLRTNMAELMERVMASPFFQPLNLQGNFNLAFVKNICSEFFRQVAEPQDL